MEGDRYSMPTIHNHSGTGKTPAICDGGFPSALAIAYLSTLVVLPD
jgi:hypothetical protein